MSIRVTVSSGNLQARARQAAQRATEIVMGELFAAFQQSFTANVWDWPRQTVRSDGSTVGSPRDLIDVGSPGLRSSGSHFMTGPYQATFKWSAPYALLTHEGGHIWAWGRRPPLKNAKRVYLPPRPWTRAVLGQEAVSGIKTYDVGDRLRNVWLAQLRRARGS
jgi:hypothetical protein